MVANNAPSCFFEQVDEAVAVLQAHQAKEATQKPVTNTAVAASV